MKINILLFFVVVLFNLGNAQNYIPYYKLVKKAEVCIFKEEYENALKYYQQAVSKVKVPATKDLYNASICAALTFNSKVMFDYMLLCLKQGVSFKKFENNNLAFKTYYQDSTWICYKKNSDAYYQTAIKSINKEYVSLLDSMAFEDQRVRNNVKWIYKLFPNTKKAKECRKACLLVDSLNRKLIIRLVDKYGYPDELQRGLKGNITAGTRNLMPFWHQRDSAFIYGVDYQALLKGAISPQRFARRYSNSVFAGFLPVMYYYFATEKKELTEEERKIANANRFKIGLLSIEEQQMFLDYLKKTKNKFQFYFDYMIRLR